jgi:hypothetical protein
MCAEVPVEQGRNIRNQRIAANVSSVDLYDSRVGIDGQRNLDTRPGPARGFLESDGHAATAGKDVSHPKRGKIAADEWTLLGAKKLLIPHASLTERAGRANPSFAGRLQ